MKKTIQQLAAFLGVMWVVLSITMLPMQFVQAAPTDQQSSQNAAANNKAILPLPETSKYGNLPAGSAGANGQRQIYDLALSILQNLRYIIGTVAIGVIILAGIKMVFAQGKEDEYDKQLKGIIYSILGLGMVGLAGETVKILNLGSGCNDLKGLAIPCVEGGFLKNPTAILRTVTLFNQKTQFIITFIKYFIGSVAVLMIIRSGLRMITMGEQEDKMAQDKKDLFYGFLGLIFIILADTAVNKVIYKVDLSHYPSNSSTGANPVSDLTRGVSEIVGITNTLVSFITPIAVLAFIIAAVLYVTAAGNEERQNRAKRIITMTIFGIILIYGAFALVSTLIGGRFSGVPAS